jgi:hypothetical protein
MYHLELRHYPHNMCRFNLSDGELSAIMLPWAREEWIEFGERKWNPQEAKMKIIEGPELPLSQLTMGRGWRQAEHQGEDVTERLLASARDYVNSVAEAEEAAAIQAAAAELASEAGAEATETPVEPSPEPSPTPKPVAPAPAQPDGALLADSLGLELLALLEDAPAPLSEAWRLAQARLPGGSAGDGLALAERAVSSLLERRLILLETADAHGFDVDVLHAAESWGAQGQPGAVLMRRA